MNNVVKGLIIAVVLVYVVSPVDICPGPVDDILAIIMAMGATKNKSIE